MLYIWYLQYSDMYNIILVFATNKIAIQEKKQLLAKTGEWIFYQTMKGNPDISERFAEKVID